MRQVAVGLAVVTVLVLKAPVVGERDRHDAPAVGVIRAVQLAQATHFSVAGYYETLQCLASALCLEPAGFSARQPLLDPEIGALKNQYDYRLLFYLGPRLPDPVKSPSATPLTAYAIVAVPVQLSDDTRRALCGDATGSIYITPGDRLPAVREGRCVDRSQPLR